MQIFNGLQDKQAIKLDNGLYVVQLNGSKNITYKVKGEIATHAYSNKQVVVENLEDISCEERTPSKVISFQSPSGEVIEANEFYKLKNEITLPYEDEDGDIVYPDIDTEYQVKKKLEVFNQYTPIKSEEVTQIVPIEIKVVGTALDTGSEFIHTPFQYGEASWLGKGVYKVLQGAIAMEEFKKIRQSHAHLKWNVPNHSHLRFVKLNTSYIFTTLGEHYSWLSNAKVSKIVTSLEEAKEEESNIRKLIRKELHPYITPVVLDAITLTDVRSKLDSVILRMGNIDVKQKSWSSYATLKKEINQLRDYITDKGDT